MGSRQVRRARPARGTHRIELDPTQITGNRELPKVLYIVPWKRSDLGDLTGRPVNSLLDEVLHRSDRDVFRRENRYYERSSRCGRGGAKRRTRASRAKGKPQTCLRIESWVVAFWSYVIQF